MRPFQVPGSLRVPLVLATASLLLVAFLALAGCSDDDDNPMGPGGGGPTSTQLTGTYINGSEGGLMTLTISTPTLAAPLRLLTAASMAADTHGVSAIATLSPDDGSAAISLTGIYDQDTDQLWLNGSMYSFYGVFDSTGSVAGIAGQYDGPNGMGFFGCAVGGTSVVKVYCGTFASSITETMGRWNIAIIGDELVGVAFPSGEGTTPVTFEGTALGTGATRTLEFSGEADGVTVTGSGLLHLSTNTVGGTWHTDAGLVSDDGTWSGDLCEQGITASSAIRR